MLWSMYNKYLNGMIQHQESGPQISCLFAGAGKQQGRHIFMKKASSSAALACFSFGLQLVGPPARIAAFSTNLWTSR